MIQKSASINIQVMDPLDAAEKVITLTDQMGGFVVSSSNGQEHYSGDIYLPHASLTIRVPAERLNEMLNGADELQYMIQIEDKLSEIRYQIENKLKMLDGQSSQPQMR